MSASNLEHDLSLVGLAEMVEYPRPPVVTEVVQSRPDTALVVSFSELKSWKYFLTFPGVSRPSHPGKMSHS